MLRLVYIMTSASSAMYIRSHLPYLRERGFEVVFISAPGDELRVIRERDGITTISVPMEREITSA